MTKVVDGRLFIKWEPFTMANEVIDFDPSISRSIFDREKEIAILVLNKIQRTAIIAGGAPRNWFLGTKAKDIDIYITDDADGKLFNEEDWWKDMPSATRLGGAPIVFPEDNTNPFSVIAQAPGESGSQKGIAHVHEFVYQELKFQVITVKKEEVLPTYSLDYGLISYINRSFDFGINKISISKNGSVHKHYDFEEDIKNKTLTVRISDVAKYNVNMLGHRFMKMKKYFPDHEVVIK